MDRYSAHVVKLPCREVTTYVEFISGQCPVKNPKYNLEVWSVNNSIDFYQTGKTWQSHTEQVCDSPFHIPPSPDPTDFNPPLPPPTSKEKEKKEFYVYESVDVIR